MTAPDLPPSGSFTVSPNGPALMGATVLTFVGTGTDPKGDAITYSWAFGDGDTSSGQNVTHVYNKEGTFNVILTLKNSKGSQNTANTSVTVRSITGHWVDVDPRFQVDFTQTGSTFTGSVTVSGVGRVSDISDGILSDARNVKCHRQSFVRGFATVDYTGSLDPSLNKMELVAVQNSATTFGLTRQ